MRTRGVKKLPVVTEDRRPVGYVRLEKIIEFVMSELSAFRHPPSA